MGDPNVSTPALSVQSQASLPLAASTTKVKTSTIRPATEKSEEQLAIARTCHHIPWCDSYERMISGMLFDPWHDLLNEARYKARIWCRRYNSDSSELESPSDLLTAGAKRLTLLADILGRTGDNVWIEPPFNFDYGCNIIVGSQFYANFNLTILDSGFVIFGDRVMVGPNVSVYSVNHPTDIRGRRANFEIAKPVLIDDDCWIGGNVVILSGVHIGKGCTIGAGSVVTRNIPDWSVAVGNPARVIKEVEPVEG